MATAAAPAPKKGGTFTRTWNGLPVWAWVGVGGVGLGGLYLFITRFRKASSTPAATTTNAGSYPGINQVVVPIQGEQGPPGPPGGPPPPTQPGTAHHDYTSTFDGETLRGFAQRVYGGNPGCAQGQCWPFILQANFQALTAAANAHRLVVPNTPDPAKFGAETPLWSGIILETDSPVPPGTAQPLAQTSTWQNSIPGGTSVTSGLLQGPASSPVPAGVPQGPVAS